MLVQLVCLRYESVRSEALTCMLRRLGPLGIRVNAVNPTVVLTDMGAMAWSDVCSILRTCFMPTTSS